MRTFLPLIALAALALPPAAATAQVQPATAAVSGAGASFPAPVYGAWAADYRTAKGVSVAYSAVGSGAGVKQIEAASVDFGATDKPLAADELAAQGLIQFPTVLGGVVPVVNLPGVHTGELKLDGPLLAEIFAGKVAMWNDPRIAALNPGLKLPDAPVTLAVRSDNSGTTFLWTSYLAAVSPAWKAGPGAGDHVEWPWALAGKGNAGVAAILSDTIGAIGYVEYAFARQNNLDLVSLKSHDGAFVAPSAAGFGAAAAKADWSAVSGFGVALIDRPGAGAWPITGATYVLVRKDAPGATRGAVLGFFDWAYANGDAAAAKLDYVPLPAVAKSLVRLSWSQQTASR